jgi:uncharacterized protein YjbI with pentapeptide repeats
MNNNNLFDYQSLKNKYVAEQLLERHIDARGEDSQPATLDFSGEKLVGLTIDGATLFYVDRYENYDPDHAYTIFNGADLRFASLCGCDARYASFKGANLTFARFSGSDLRGADFSDAVLACTDFSNVKGFEGAKFALTAQLLSCDFSGTDVSKAKFYTTINGRRRHIELQVGADGRLELGDTAALGALASTVATEFKGLRLQSDFLISAFGQHVKAAQRDGALPNAQPALAGFMSELEKTVREVPKAPFKAAKPR